MFEVAKSVLATGLWLWLILDSAFGPWRIQHHDHVPDTYADPDYIRRRVQRDALASLLLMYVCFLFVENGCELMLSSVFFYPPLGYSYVVWRTKSSHGDLAYVGDNGEDGEDGEERAPLLSRSSGRTLG
jgi:hypothetical protein